MKKLVTIEKELLAFSEKNPSSPEAKAFCEMLRFWEVYDEIFCDNHSTTLKIVYSKSDSKKSNVYKYMKACLTEQPYIRRRKQYLSVYEAYLKRIRQDEKQPD